MCVSTKNVNILCRISIDGMSPPGEGTKFPFVAISVRAEVCKDGWGAVVVPVYRHVTPYIRVNFVVVLATPATVCYGFIDRDCVGIEVILCPLIPRLSDSLYFISRSANASA